VDAGGRLDYFLWEGAARLGRIVELPENTPPGESEGTGWVDLDAGRVPHAPTMQMGDLTHAGPIVTQFPIEQPLSASADRRQGDSPQFGVERARPLTAAEAAPMRDEYILSIRRADGSTVATRGVFLVRMSVPPRAAAAPRPYPAEFWMVSWSA
jgi:hypothetical protein